MKEIAYIPLTPLGDVICCMNQLECLKRFYAPCRLTVFAIPLVAQLLRNYRCVDEVVVLAGNVHGSIDLSSFVPPDVEYDAIFNMSYYLDGLELQKRLKCNMRYGGQSCYLTRELCEQNFDKWVSDDYWQTITLKRYANVCGQLGEIVRLAVPSYECACTTLSPETYCVEPCPVPLPDNMVMFIPGTSALRKYWPVGKYFAVAKCLKKLGKNPVFVIGPQDRTLTDALMKSGYPVLDTLPLPQLADAILHAELVIGNDSGPMHFAAAFQRPTVHIFASSSAFNWYPYEAPLHSLVMPTCGSRETCRGCAKTCIGRITVQQVLGTACERLNLPMPEVKQVAYFAQDRIGDSLTAISNIEEAASIYAPCEITVFETAGMMPLFENYAFADHCVLLQDDKTDIPTTHFDAVFNSRYDKLSAEIIRKLNVDTAYGYENVDIPESVCKEIYNGGYLPLSMWDDVQLRRHTSVTEQAACLIRLVEPSFHCQYPSLGENTLCIDFQEVWKLNQPRKSVLFVLGGSYRAKCWPLENYLKLIQEAVSPAGFSPYFLLGPDEEDYVPMLDKMGYPYAFCASLTQIAGLAIQWLTNRALAIGNDTGVMHLLKILGCRSITISAHDCQATWEPYDAERHWVMAPPLFRHQRLFCLRHGSSLP